MSGKTDGRRAYDAWWATAEGVPRHPDVTYDQDADAWEAAAAAGAASAHQRVAELVTKGNELRAENAYLRNLAEEIISKASILTAYDDGGLSALIDHLAQRAGIAPAVVTAGTEHLAEKIRGLAIPDEES